jgi:two-component system phosphoglycerate transport system sensor histidine kinase PgtB
LLYEYQKLIETENIGLTNELQEKNKILKENFEKLEKAHSDLKNFQEQLIQSSKAISLGTLGAGMAHEINNPLTIIQNYNKKLNNALSEQSFDRENVQHINLSINKAVTRIKTIVEHLREFSKEDSRDANKMTEIKMNSLLYDLRDFYGGFITRFNIDIRENFNTEEIVIKGFKTPMEQVLLNVIHNAVDAVEKNDDKVIELVTYMTDQHGVIEIIDNGPGISPENCERIFDPFFTTKEIGKGVGLGLSLVRNYMNECQGIVEFKSIPGKTSFILKFKRA